MSSNASTPQALPRILIAAPASGGGKTTLATGLMAALAARDLAVAPFKVGPDYIDPGYHALATGRRGRNLDAVLCGEELITPLLLHGARAPESCDVAVIEGVMGLFDGQLGTGGRGSSAHIAALTRTPVVLVIDCSHASRTHAAVAAGLARFDPAITVAGVILNRIASDRHAGEISTELRRIGLPVLGRLPRSAEVSVPSRHLGLIPADERGQADEQVRALGRLVAEHVDLDAVLDVARSAPRLDGTAWEPTHHVTPVAGSPKVAVAGGRAFTFSYAETTELLAAAGCEPVVFDPLIDTELPPGTCGLLIGGGFPEVHAADLAANRRLLDAIHSAVCDGMPVVAECAGLLLLGHSLEGHRMADVVPATAAMRSRLTMGYRSAVAVSDTLIARAGERVHGHEFHRTGISPLPDAEFAPAWRVELPDDRVRDDGASLAPRPGPPSVHASYLHLHWASFPQAAQRFAEAARAFQRHGGGFASSPTPSVAKAPEPDLGHHGDRDLGSGLIDFAVNVAVASPPAWLLERITARAGHWAGYPDAAAAREALAAHHGLRPEQLLPTAGAAEAFTLVARAFRPRRAVVVHPQFTEPEAALRAAGHAVDRLVLGPENGFRLNVHAVPPDADLVVIGNPTNPTGVLHPAETLAALVGPGRVVMVDEAFMDVTGEAQSLLPGPLEGVLVLRSLTKTFGLAGLRAGYVAGDPELIRGLAAQQTPWSVSTPAIDAMLACCTPEAAEHTAAITADLPARRDALASHLRSLGLRVVDSEAPFLLVETSAIDRRRSIRPALAERGIAVRRGESFPGLSETWIRLAVRDPERHALLIHALEDLIRSNQ